MKRGASAARYATHFSATHTSIGISRRRRRPSRCAQSSARVAPFPLASSSERSAFSIDRTMEQVRVPSVAFEIWKSSGAFATLIPALADVSEHDLRVPDQLAMPLLESRPARRVLRYAGLLSGIPPKAAIGVMTSLKASK